MGALDKAWREVGKALVKASDRPGLFKYGKESAIGVDPAEVAARYGMVAGKPTHVPRRAADSVQFILPSGNRATISRFDRPEEWGLSVGRGYRMDDKADEMVRVYDKLGKPVTDIDALDASSVPGVRGEGSLLYRALYDLNKGWGALNTTGMLTPVNRVRRTENMLSTLLRDPEVGERILVDPYQMPNIYSVRGKTGRQQVDFGSRPLEDRVGILAKIAMQNADAATAGLSGGMQVGPLTATGRDYLDLLDQIAASRNAIRIGAMGGSPAGEATLRRAALIRGLRDEAKRGVPGEELGEAIVESTHPFYDSLFYRKGGRV